MSFLFVHSLTEEKLLKALELGGFPLPSVAVIKPDTNFTSFGNITFIIKPEVLNPKDKKNLIYDRDIFSQRIPEIEFDVNKKEFDKIYFDLLKTSNGFDSFYNFHDIDSLKRKPSSYIKDRFESSLLLRKEFFTLHNPNYTPPLSERKLKSLLAENPTFIEYIKNNEIVLEDEFKEVLLKATFEVEEHYSNLLGNDIARSIASDFLNSIFKLGFNNEYLFKNRTVDMHFNNTLNDIKKDKEVLNGNNLELDLKKYESDINTFIYSDLNAFNKYIEKNYLSKIFYNPHFKQGNRKIEYSLANIERSMLKQKVIGVEDVCDTSVGKISSHFAKQFKSFEDININLDNLNHKEERFEQKDSLHKSIFNLTEKVFPFFDGSRFFEAQEAFSGSLRYGLNKELFFNQLKKNGFDVESFPANFFEECSLVVNEILSLDNHYFEGKPQKTLYLEDFQAVLLPKNSSTYIVDFLKDKVKIHFYDKNDLTAKSDIFSQYEFNIEQKIEKKSNKSLTRNQI